VHIRRIELKNVRCFASLDLRLVPDGESSAGWTVLAGRNATGKSTLLQSLALALTGTDLEGFDHRASEWVRWDAEAAWLKPSLSVSSDDAFDLTVDLAYAPTSWSDLVEQARRHHRLGDALTYEIQWDGRPRTHTTADATSTSISDSEHGRELALRGPLDQGKATRGWFAAGYGPVRRLSSAADTAQWSRRDAGFASLFRDDVGLREGVEALKNLNHRALSLAMTEAERQSAARVERLAIDLLNDLLRERDAQVLGVAPDGLRVLQGGRERRLERMSDGYRVVVALVLDILMRMHAAFGEQLVEERVLDERGVSRVVVRNSGVVLIDEVEQHLHPSWQQEIGFWLTEHFPQVQFIVTTHSPFVCQAASPGRLFRCPASGEAGRSVEAVSKRTWAAVVHGTVDDAVMSDLFGVDHLFSPRTERLRAEAATLEVKAIRGSASQAELARLKEILSQLPSNDASIAEQSRRTVERL
jgi:predicted ATPase